MDCQLAQQTLDAARPDRSDWDAPELRDAVSHFDGCESCRKSLGQRQQWDERLSAALSDVSVPVGLQDRLLAAVAASDASSAKVLSTGIDATPRRRWLAWTTAAAVAVLAGVVGWQFVAPQGVALELSDVSQQLDEQLLQSDVSSGQPFDGGFDANPADPVWRDAVRGVTAIGLDLAPQSGDEAAAYRFTAGRVRGWLVVLPKSRISDPPTIALPDYDHFQPGANPRVAWTEGEHVYLCVLDRGVSARDLLTTFYGGAA